MVQPLLSWSAEAIRAMDELGFLFGALTAVTLVGGSLSSRHIPPRILLPVILLFIAATFAVDSVTPLGIPVWVPYLIPILLAFWLPRSYAPMLIALGCGTLTLIGWRLSPPGVAPD